MGVMPDVLASISSYAAASRLIDVRRDAFLAFKAAHGSKGTTGKQLAKAEENGFEIPDGKLVVYKGVQGGGNCWLAGTYC